MKLLRTILLLPLWVLHYLVLAQTAVLEWLGVRELLARAGHFLAWCILWPLCRLWFRIEVGGLENLPVRGPAILCPNHQSFLDPPLLGLACPRDLVFFARKDLFDSLLAGPLARFFGAEPIGRDAGDSAVEQMARTLARRRGFVVLYPEGTIPAEARRFRTDVEPETGLLQGRTGPVRLALRLGAPLVPVGISGAGAALPPEAIPHGKLSWLPRRRKVRIRFGRPMEVSVPPERSPDRAFLRRQTDRLMREISALVDFSLSEPPYRVPLGPEDYERLRAYEARFYPGRSAGESHPSSA